MEEWESEEKEPREQPPPEFDHKIWIPAPDAIWLARYLKRMGFIVRVIPAPASEFKIVTVFYDPPTADV